MKRESGMQPHRRLTIVVWEIASETPSRRFGGGFGGGRPHGRFRKCNQYGRCVKASRQSTASRPKVHLSIFCIARPKDTATSISPSILFTYYLLGGIFNQQQQEKTIRIKQVTDSWPFFVWKFGLMVYLYRGEIRCLILRTAWGISTKFITF